MNPHEITTKQQNRMVPPSSLAIFMTFFRFLTKLCTILNHRLYGEKSINIETMSFKNEVLGFQHEGNLIRVEKGNKQFSFFLECVRLCALKHSRNRAFKPFLFIVFHFIPLFSFPYVLPIQDSFYKKKFVLVVAE
jgi:hypothetical protein